MRYFIRLVLFVFLVLAAFITFLQTPFGKRELKNLLIEFAKDQGYALSIESLEGNIPFEWTLKNVSIHPNASEKTLFAKSLKTRFAILPLFKKELHVTYFKLLKGSYAHTSFDATALFKVDLKNNKPFTVSYSVIEGKELYIHFSGQIAKENFIPEGTLFFSLPSLAAFSPFPLEGKATGKAEIIKGKAYIECAAEQLFFNKKQLPPHHFTLEAVYQEEKGKEEKWQGTISLSGGHVEIPLEGNIHFSYSPSVKLISIHDLIVTGPKMRFFGKLDLDPAFHFMEGTLFAELADLKKLSPLFPSSALSGRLGSKIDFQRFSDFQDLQLQIEAEELFGFGVSIHSLSLDTTVHDVFRQPRATILLEAKETLFDQFEFSTIQLRSHYEPSSSPFFCTLKGRSKDPIELNMEGNWQRKNGDLSIQLKDLSGFALKKPFYLIDPFLLEYSSLRSKMSPCHLQVAEGNVSWGFDLNKNSALIHAKAEDFPLEFLSLLLKHFSLEGKASFDLDLTSWQEELQGSCNVAIQQARILSENKEQSLKAKGSCQIHFNQKTAQLHGSFKAEEEQFVELLATLPIEYGHFPFHLKLSDQKPFSAELTLEGKLQTLSEFINVGASRLEGWLSSHLFFSNTLSEPFVRGSAEVQEGAYENYYTGTTLKNITLRGTASNQNFHITSFEATDYGEGSLKAEGIIALKPKEHFPFSIKLFLHQLNTISFDTLTGKFTGQAIFSGNLTHATMKGALKVGQCHFRIPDAVASSTPLLPITFINPPEHLNRKKSSLVKTSSPLYLDLDLEVPGNAFVEGRGLHTELKGKFHLLGTYTDFVAKGKLQLVKGEYILSGKVFNLTQADLIFYDKPTPSAYISVSGNCDIPAGNVSVNMRGPLTAPKVAFQSNPTMSTSSILSQILFNKDASEISAIQALQLAQTVISLSSHSAPDILEKIRKTLGVDRLTLVSSETDPGKVSLQIGKYLMRGFLLTLSQGSEGRNVSLELELKKGILFQAEVGEDQQGKFSLKWHRDY